MDSSTATLARPGIGRRSDGAATTDRAGRIGRGVLAASMVLAPLAVLIIRALIPFDVGDSGAQQIAAAASHPTATRIALAADLVASVTLPLAIVGVVALVRRRAPMLATVGGILALVGWCLVPLLAAGDALTYEMSTVAPNAANGALLDRFDGDVVVNVLTTVFVAFHTLGTLLLGIALGRSRVVPRWAAAAVVAAAALHPVAVVSGVRGLDAGAISLLLIGFAAASVAAVRR